MQTMFLVPNRAGCPECSSRKNEKIVGILIKKHVKYKQIEINKSNNLIDKNKKLRPDFCLYFENKIVIIERNGEQHYGPVNFGQGIEQAKKDYIKQVIRDVKLRTYCKENNIYLLEIPYWWKEDKIIEELKKLNSL